MEDSPYRKLFHIRKYGRFSLSEVFHFPGGKGAILGPDLENSIARNRGSFQRGSWEPGFLPAGIQRPVSFLGSGRIQNLSIFAQQFVPYCSISLSNSGNNLCTQVNRSCSFSAGFPQAGHRSSSPAISGSTQAGTTF
ncbi:hypothetical protein F2Q68_00005068 [Brassica cretica]|uniref:Uncharacterized protein n=1 Tax=Brassica cretica TaxID=69181 RepID=A0A8S9J968_BRACR|nr:hypothetical protein F2Q68_00005068 [Brassica cretica]